MAKSNAPQHNDIIFYNTPTGNVKIEVIFNAETFWLTQKRLAKLFGVEVPAINKHLGNIYETGELDKQATISILETVQQEILAEKAYSKFRVIQDRNFESDFDKEVKKIIDNPK